MEGSEDYVNERLDHLGIVAGVCQEIGLAAWLNAQEPGSRQQVSVGTATVAMVLNGLGFSNRQLYLVPQFFANKPLEHLLGSGITAEMRECRLLGAHPGLVVRPRSDKAVCWDRDARPAALWHQSRTGACGYDLLLGEWRVRAGRESGRRGSDRYHLWLFA
jgi:DNA-binding transcriptional LysR family regulator